MKNVEMVKFANILLILSQVDFEQPVKITLENDEEAPEESFIKIQGKDVGTLLSRTDNWDKICITSWVEDTQFPSWAKEDCSMSELVGVLQEIFSKP